LSGSLRPPKNASPTGAVKGVRLRRGGESTSRDPRSSFLAGTARPLAFNARLKFARERARVPVMSTHPLRHTAATLLLNERGANLRDVQTAPDP